MTLKGYKQTPEHVAKRTMPLRRDPPLTSEVLLEAKERANSVKEACEELGISDSTWYVYCKRLDIDPKVSPNPRIRTCRTCSASEEDVPFHADGGPNALACKACLSKMSRSWAVRNPERAKDAVLRRRFDKTFEWYSERLQDQGFACAICKQPADTFKYDLAVDHDSTCCASTRNGSICGKCVRGLLCGSCNRGLGLFQHDTEVLKSAIDYMEAFTHETG